jgi:hypothetical protein
MSHPSDHQLVAYFRGTATRELAELVKAHLADCRSCSQLISMLDRISGRQEDTHQDLDESGRLTLPKGYRK